MKRKKALELQAAWGGGRCDHPGFAKEYHEGERTRNFICTQCGAFITIREKVEITRARREAEGESGSS